MGNGNIHNKKTNKTRLVQTLDVKNKGESLLTN